VIEFKVKNDLASEIKPQDKPPIKEPPNRPEKPPVKEPEDPPQPPPPSDPPVQEPPTELEEPPVKEPPPKDPDRDTPRKPPMRVHRFQCSGARQFTHHSKLIAHRLEAGRPGSQQADGDAIFEHPSFPAFQPY
jgi:hypothetical protein